MEIGFLARAFGLLLLFGFALAQNGGPTDPFMSLTPTDQPQILLPGFVSTQFGEINGSFPADGKEFFFTVTFRGLDAIAVSKMRADGSWTQPEIASFSGEHPDYDPLFAPDGKLYISSERPSPKNPDGGTSAIWVMEKEGAVWGEPTYIALTKNSDYHSTVTRDGVIYFNSRDEQRGNQDIFTATPNGSGYTVENLGNTINTGATEADPFVAPDGSYLMFRSYRREGLGNADLYISFKIDGEWQKAQNLGAPINSAYREMCPIVTPDGNTFIFASERILESYYGNTKTLKQVAEKFQSSDNGHLNLYFMKADFIQTLKNKALEQ